MIHEGRNGTGCIYSVRAHRIDWTRTQILRLMRNKLCETRFT